MPTPADLEIISRWKRQGIIESIDPGQLTASIILGCGDCDRFPEFYDYHRRQFENRGERPRLHPILVNGGALNLVYPERGPNRNHKVLAFLLGQIAGAIKLKKLRRTETVFHWPCGQGRDEWGLSLEESASLFVEANRLIEAHTRTEGVIRFHHDRNGEVMKTYHFKPNRYAKLSA